MCAQPRPARGAPPWGALIEDLRRPHRFEPLAVDGALPPELVGTLYRNGPGSFGVGGRRFGHLFDGDGAITAIRLDGAGATGAVRFVDTEGRRREQALGRPRYTGFGTIGRRPLLDLVRGEVKNAANTSVLPWQGRLLALWEGGLPTALDLGTLDTLGPTDLDGVVPRALCAHPHRVPSRRSWFAFGVRLGRHTAVDLFQLPDAGTARRLVTFRIGAGMLHDFAVTATHAVFLVSPLIFRPLGFALGRRSYVDSLDWRPELGTEIVLVALDAPHRIRRFRAPAFYQWHFGNAFDDGGRVVVDLVRYPDFGSDRWLRSLYAGAVDRPADGVIVRATVDPAAETLEAATVWDRPAEFPICDDRTASTRHRVLWACAHADRASAARGPHDRLVRIEVDSGAVRETDLGPGTWPSEPVFVPRVGSDRRGEGDGWLLSVAYDGAADRSFLAVLDATTLDVLARAWFDQPIPLTFHGRWHPG